MKIVREGAKDELTVTASNDLVEGLLRLMDKHFVNDTEGAIRELGLSPLFRFFAPKEMKSAIEESREEKEPYFTLELVMKKAQEGTAIPVPAIPSLPPILPKPTTFTLTSIPVEKPKVRVN